MTQRPACSNARSVFRSFHSKPVGSRLACNRQKRTSPSSNCHREIGGSPDVEHWSSALGKLRCCLELLELAASRLMAVAGRLYADTAMHVSISLVRTLYADFGSAVCSIIRIVALCRTWGEVRWR
jgi:hypothetical protein